MSETRKTLTIATLERLRLSAYGNPRFKVTFTDGTSANTQTDSSINYGIENREFQNVPLHVTFSRAGMITALTVADNR